MEAEQCWNTSLSPNKSHLKHPKEMGIRGNLVSRWTEGRKPSEVTQLEVSLLHRPQMAGHLETEYELSIIFICITVSSL